MQGQLRLYFTVALVVVMGLAAAVDLRSRRVPNVLVAMGMAAALLPRFAVGLPAVGMGVAGAGVGLLIGLALFALGAMAGGDGKLLMVIGAFFGPVQLFGALLSIAVAGGILAIAAAIGG